MSKLYEKIYEVVKRIPDGAVATYGQIALLATGNIRHSRVVGFALHVNPDPDTIDCFKVVNRAGKLAPAFAFGGAEEQQARLEKSGVEVEDGCVDLKRFLWNPH